VAITVRPATVAATAAVVRTARRVPVVIPPGAVILLAEAADIRAAEAEAITKSK
jgi:hypothetical protein